MATRVRSSRSTSVSQLEPPPLAARVLASVAASDNADSVGQMLQLASGQLDSLLQDGVFTSGSLERAATSIIRTYEDGRGFGPSYVEAAAALDRLSGQLSDYQTLVRYSEREAGFALGLALGLRMGGAR